MLNSPSAQCVGETQWRKERGNGARDLLNFVEFRERRWGVLINAKLYNRYIVTSKIIYCHEWLDIHEIQRFF